MSNCDNNPPEIQSATEAEEATNVRSHPLVVDLSISDKLIEAGELILVFSVSNQSDKPIYVLRDHSPFESLSNHNFSVSLDDEEIDYTGIYMKRLSANWCAFHELRPGAFQSLEINLMEYYLIEKSGLLKVEFNLSRMRFCDRKPYKNIPSKKLSLSLLSIEQPNPTLEYSFNFSDLIKRPERKLISHEKNLSYKNYPDFPNVFLPDVHIPDATICAQVESSHLIAYKLIQKTLDYIGDYPNKIIEWFGWHEDNTIIYDNYAKLKDYFETNTVEYRMGNQECDCRGPNIEECRTVAYKNVDTIFLCTAFFDHPKMQGQRQRASTIIHEISHIVLKTEDHSIDEREAHDLAQKKPLKALCNADTYGFFCEEFYSLLSNDDVKKRID
jgi:Lysine-specific metallo-endopeptidase